MDKKFVVVCTDKRGVFAGYLEDGGLGHCVLTEARMCLYWERIVGGVLGLSQTGPSEASRISALSPRIELPDVHAVMDCSDQARAAWIAAPAVQ